MNSNDIKRVLRLNAKRTSMIRRCHSPNADKRTASEYRDRGIEVCKEWRENPVSFIEWCINNGEQEGLQLDRIDVDKGYSPENCRFVTPVVNGRNRRNTVWLTAFGETKPLGAWMEDPRCAADYATIHARVQKEPAWDHERAISTPSTRPSKKKN